MLENEYVERNAVLKLLSEEKEFYAQNKETDDAIDLAIAAGMEKAVLSIKNGLRDIPNAGVVPVVHGKWDSIPNEYISIASKNGSYHGNATSCSVCNEINPNAYKTNYCPNCGAKMDLREGKQ